MTPRGDLAKSAGSAISNNAKSARRACRFGLSKGPPWTTIANCRCRASIYGTRPSTSWLYSRVSFFSSFVCVAALGFGSLVVLHPTSSKEVIRASRTEGRLIKKAFTAFPVIEPRKKLRQNTFSKPRAGWEPKSRRRSWRLRCRSTPSLHAHRLIPAIHVNDLSGDGRRTGTREENARLAKFVGMAAPLERRVFFVVL